MHRITYALSYALAASVIGCSSSPSSSAGATADTLVAAGDIDETDTSAPPDAGPPPPDTSPPEGCTPFGPACVPVGDGNDSLTYVGAFDGASFVEIVDTEPLGDYALQCNGTKGLSVYYAPDDQPPRFRLHSGGLGTGASSQFPRCQHLEIGAVAGDPHTSAVEVFVTNRGDETQPTPWIKRVVFADGLDAIPNTFTNTAAPVVSTLPGDAETRSFEGLAYHDGLLYAAAHFQGLVIVDTTDGDDMNVAGTVPTEGNAFDVAVVGDSQLAVAFGDGSLGLYSITDPLAPSLLGAVDLPGAPTALAIRDQTAFVAAGSVGTHIVDLSDASTPRLVRTLPSDATTMDVHTQGDYLAVAGWTDVRVYDVSQPENAWLMATETVPTTSSFSRTLTAAVAGTRVLAGEWTGLHTYQLVTGQTPPEITTGATELLFDAEGQTIGLIIRNEGFLPLEVTASVVPGGYSLNANTLTVAPDDAEFIEVTADGSPVSASLILDSNDPDEPSVAVRLGPPPQGSGIGVGDVVDLDARLRDVRTGDQTTLGEVLDGKVALLAYFATF